MNRQGITLLKLGGSTITDKASEKTVREAVLTELITAVASAQAQSSDHFIIGHGSGSFAHIPSKKYRTHEGFVDENSLYGMAVTQDTAALLNRIVVTTCLRKNIPAVSFNFSNTLVTTLTNPASFNDAVLLEYLKKGLTPVISGDVIVDSEQGSCIWSADRILPYLSGVLGENGFSVSRLVHITNTPGVYKDFSHKEKGVFEVLTKADFPTLIGSIDTVGAIGATEGTDITGGMLQKITESLALAETGVESIIVSGSDPENVTAALLGKEFTGTTVR